MLTNDQLAAWDRDAFLHPSTHWADHARGTAPGRIMTTGEGAFVTARDHMAGYMAARDAWLADVTRLPASTLVIVSGFTRPEFLVEVEVTAAAP